MSRLLEDWDSGEESSEVPDRMGVLAFGQWNIHYNFVRSYSGPPGTKGGGEQHPPPSGVTAACVTECLKDSRSQDLLRLVVEPHDAWDRKLQALTVLLMCC